MSSERGRADLRAVEVYLDATMAGEPDRALAVVAPGFVARFTGGREYDSPAGPTGFNAARYSWVKKRIERYGVIEAGSRTIVYSLGTLYGAWPDGKPFEGNRYIDRFVVEDGLILETDVWNDSAEWILDPACAR
nr:nuclear transport factor 2 family protein [Aureimonas mangrovi]